MMTMYVVPKPGASCATPAPTIKRPTLITASVALSTACWVGRGCATRSCARRGGDDSGVVTNTFSPAATPAVPFAASNRPHIQHLRDDAEHSAPQSGQVRKIEELNFILREGHDGFARSPGVAVGGNITRDVANSIKS